MAVKPRTVEKEEELKEEEKVEEVKTSEGMLLEPAPKLKIYYRDIATRWPASDENAENALTVEDDISNYLDDGWKIETVDVVGTKTIGDMTDEFVISVLFIMSR